MLPVSEELKKKLQIINQSLQTAFPHSDLHYDEIRRRLEKVGSFHKIPKWGHDQLKDWLGDRTMVGVDGSVNSIPGNQLRTLSLFQALAKGLKPHEEKWKADVHTPLLDERLDSEAGSAAREARERGTLLSSLELSVAQEAIIEWQPRVVMMDGSLIHFLIDHSEGWAEFVRTAEEKGVILVGVAEEIQSYRLVHELFPEYPSWSDRDLLYGILQVGEWFEWQDWNPSNHGLWKMVLRTSKSPQPIAIDGLDVQHNERINLASLVYRLTPEQGRGIPYWLDIVDNQVRVTNALLQTLVEQYIDPEIRHRILMLKRSDRSI